MLIPTAVRADFHKAKISLFHVNTRPRNEEERLRDVLSIVDLRGHSSANAIKSMYSSIKKYSPPSLTRSGDLSFRKEKGSCLPFSFQLNSTLLRECMITRKFHRHSIDIRTLFLLVYTSLSLYGFRQATLSRNLLNFFNQLQYNHSWAKVAFFVS